MIEQHAWQLIEKSKVAWFMSAWNKLESLWKEDLKMSPPDCPGGKPLVHFLDWWWVWEDPVHCGWGYLWAGDNGDKVGRTEVFVSEKEQGAVWPVQSMCTSWEEYKEKDICSLSQHQPLLRVPHVVCQSQLMSGVSHWKKLDAPLCCLTWQGHWYWCLLGFFCLWVWNFFF